MTSRVIGVTGPRRLTSEQRAIVRLRLAEVMVSKGAGECRLHVGDALGVDAVAWELRHMCYGWALHEAEGHQPWQLQKRSRAMVDSLSCSGGELHAWPNKHCPAGMTAERWLGSGTWGTLLYAATKGVPLVVHTELMPGGYELPDWVHARQATLL